MIDFRRYVDIFRGDFICRQTFAKFSNSVIEKES